MSSIIAEVARLTHRAGGIMVVDNVFATPLLQKPMTLGADVVVYSATKHIDGQGRALGGAILATEKFIKEDLGQFYRHTGPSLSPFNAWLLLKGLETIELRVERQCRTATAIAQFLESHPKVGRVIYPGLPSHPQYELIAAPDERAAARSSPSTSTATRTACFRFLDALRLVDISNNLGDSKSIVTHPGDDDPFAPQARGARRARDRRFAGAVLRRARRRGGSDPRPGTGAGYGVYGQVLIPVQSCIINDLTVP